MVPVFSASYCLESGLNVGRLADRSHGELRNEPLQFVGGELFLADNRLGKLGRLSVTDGMGIRMERCVRANLEMLERIGFDRVLGLLVFFRMEDVQSAAGLR